MRTPTRFSSRRFHATRPLAMNDQPATSVRIVAASSPWARWPASVGATAAIPMAMPTGHRAGRSHRVPATADEKPRATRGTGALRSGTSSAEPTRPPFGPTVPQRGSQRMSVSRRAGCRAHRNGVPRAQERTAATERALVRVPSASERFARQRPSEATAQRAGAVARARPAEGIAVEYLSALLIARDEVVFSTCTDDRPRCFRTHTDVTGCIPADRAASVADFVTTVPSESAPVPAKPPRTSREDGAALVDVTAVAGARARKPVVGRDAELACADAFLASAAEGPAALVIEGDAGIGKTTVWRLVVARAEERGFNVMAARPAEVETKLALGAVSDLLEGVPSEAFAVLPAPQRHALDVALLRAEPSGGALDPRTVATAVRSLLGAMSRKRPLIVALDDVQWLDPTSAAVFAFALRRLGDLPVGWLCARRPAAPAPLPVDALVAPAALTHVTLGPLTIGALHHVLKDRLERSL